MGIVFRQSVKTSIVIFTGALLGALVIFLSLKYIPKQELGYTRTLTNQAVIASQFLLAGLNVTLVVYIHKFTDSDERKRVLLSLCFLLPLVIVAIATIIYFLFKKQVVSLFQAQDIPLMWKYFCLQPIFTFFYIYQILLEQYLGSQMRVAIATFLREILSRVLAIALILLFGFGLISFNTFIIATVFVYIIPIGLLFLLASREQNFKFSLNWKVFTRKEYNSIAHFAWYHSLLNISIILIGALDVLMLGPLDKNGLSSVAVYTTAVFIMSLLQMPYKAMMPATFPILTQAYESKDHHKVNDLFVRSSLNIFIASILVAILIGCNLQNAVFVMPKGYEAVIPLTIIMMVGRLADIATGMNDQLLSISNYYKLNFYLSLGVVIFMIVFNVLFIPVYGMYGAAWSTAIALVLHNLAKLYFVKRHLNLLPFSSNTLRVIVCALPPLLAGIYLPYILNPYVDSIIRSMLIVLLYGGMLFWLRPSADLMTYLSAVRRNRNIY